MTDCENELGGGDTMIMVASWSAVGAAVRRLLTSPRPAALVVINEADRIEGLISAGDLAWALRIHGPALWHKQLRGPRREMGFAAARRELAG
jgi:hypothetical protein